MPILRSADLCRCANEARNQARIRKFARALLPTPRLPGAIPQVLGTLLLARFPENFRAAGRKARNMPGHRAETANARPCDRWSMAVGIWRCRRRDDGIFLGSSIMITPGVCWRREKQVLQRGLQQVRNGRERTVIQAVWHKYPGSLPSE